jgi:5-methyltetrahydropteroyltriglutamate--homocysteine methyltransferase
MRLVLANHSSYPRVGEGPQAQRLRRAYAQRETGKLDDAGFEGVVDSYVAEVIAEQEAGGLEQVTDGLVYAYDLMSHPASRLEGIEIRGLVRFFDTNTYVRQPEVVGTIGGTFGLAADFARARPKATRELKVAVVGPYTLARHTLHKGNGDFLHTATAYAEALAAELEALNAAGATFVQIDEPSLLRQPDDAELVRNLLERATRTKGNLTLSLTTYFGDATTIYGELMVMPVDVVGFDLIYDPTIADAIVHHGADRPVALGAIDGRNTKLDDTRVVAHTVDRVAGALDARGVDRIYLQPSCGLEFLPRDRAVQKLGRMKEIADATTKVSA